MKPVGKQWNIVLEEIHLESKVARGQRETTGLPDGDPTKFTSCPRTIGILLENKSFYPRVQLSLTLRLLSDYFWHLWDSKVFLYVMTLRNNPKSEHCSIAQYFKMLRYFTSVVYLQFIQHKYDFAPIFHKLNNFCYAHIYTEWAFILKSPRPTCVMVLFISIFMCRTCVRWPAYLGIEKCSQMYILINVEINNPLPVVQILRETDTVYNSLHCKQV